MLRFLRKKQTLLVWALVALTETAVAIPWLIFFYSILGIKAWPDALPKAWLPLLTFSVASAWEAGDRGQNEGGNIRRAAAAPVGVIAALLAAYFTMPVSMRTGLLSGHPAWAMLPVAIYLWYQGTVAVTDGTEYSRLFSGFTVKGLIAVGGIVMLVVSRGAADPRAQLLLYWSVILLFAAGLLSLIVARDQVLLSGQARTGDQGERRFRTSPIVGGIIFGLLLLTIAASYVLSPERLAALGGSVFSAVAAALSWVADVVLLVVYRWMMMLSPLMTWLINWIMAQAQKNPQKPPEVTDGDDGDLPTGQELKDFTFLAPYVKIALVVAGITILAIMLYRFSRRERKNWQEGEEEVVSLGFWQNLLGDLKALFARPGDRQAGKAEAAGELLDPRDPRMLFRLLQAWGASLGRPRAQSETPASYRLALASREPVREPQIRAITDAYNQARYGSRPPASATVDEAVAAAEELGRGESVPSLPNNAPRGL
jgi:hypothetical protein